MKLKLVYLKLYIINNWLAATIIFYFIITVILRTLSIIDITVPCLWTKIFGIRCLGCGLTTATIHLLKLQPIEAFNINPLIYLVGPSIIYYIIKDFLHFREKNSLNK